LIDRFQSPWLTADCDSGSAIKQQKGKTVMAEKITYSILGFKACKTGVPQLPLFLPKMPKVIHLSRYI